MRRSVVVLALVLMAAAGCGQKDAGTEIASAGGKADASTASKQKAEKGDPEKFAKCLRENGIDVQFSKDGEKSGGLVKVEAGKGGTGKAAPADPKKFEAAHEKCKKYAPTGESAAQLSEADKKKMLEHARCMRKEGIDMPDPKFDGGATSAIRIPKDTKKFEAALKKCGGNGSGATLRIGGGK
jgi:hypothetical protein